MLSPLVVIAILIVVSAPVFVFFAWILFDDLRDSKESMLLGLLKAAAVIVSFRLFARILATDDDDYSMFNMIVLLGCALLLFGEYSALKAWWPSLISK